jgi:polyhydroxyalkanoate synthase
MYRDNKLVESGGITIDGVKIDMGKVKTPSYFLSTKDDHIAPWKATYAATQLFKGPVNFTLAGSGHVAGVINSPKANKYSHWTAPKNPADPEEWFNSATQSEGSWWTHWGQWLAPHSGTKIPARKPGEGKLKPLEPAPGSYVKKKI